MKSVMGDWSMKKIMGTLHDVLVTVKHFTISVDFVVVNMDTEIEVSIILGHPFVPTRQALLNAQGKELNLLMNG